MKARFAHQGMIPIWRGTVLALLGILNSASAAAVEGDTVTSLTWGWFKGGVDVGSGNEFQIDWLTGPSSAEGTGIFDITRADGSYVWRDNLASSTPSNKLLLDKDNVFSLYKSDGATVGISLIPTTGRIVISGTGSGIYADTTPVLTLGAGNSLVVSSLTLNSYTSFRQPLFHGAPGESSFALSMTGGLITGYDIVSSTAISAGKVSGPYSTAMSEGEASGPRSTAMSGGRASGSYSTAMSYGIASYSYATAMSRGEATQYAATALSGGDALYDYSTAMSGGIAQSSYSTAMSMGTAGGSYSTALSGGYTQGYYSAAFSSGTASGQSATAMSTGTAVGQNNTAISGGLAEGHTSVTLAGGTTTSTSFNSVGMSGGSASATSAAAMSTGSATGNRSTAMSGGSASGTNAIAAGLNARATSFGSAAFGRYNVQTGNATAWNETDPLFVIGNGTSGLQPMNAFALLKNGNTTITNRAWKLHVAANPGAALADPPATTTDSGGEALVVEGHTKLKGKVTIEARQGDISMGEYE